MRDDPPLALGVNAIAGEVTNAGVAEAHGMTIDAAVRDRRRVELSPTGAHAGSRRARQADPTLPRPPDGGTRSVDRPTRSRGVPARSRTLRRLPARRGASRTPAGVDERAVTAHVASGVGLGRTATARPHRATSVVAGAVLGPGVPPLPAARRRRSRPRPHRGGDPSKLASVPAMPLSVDDVARAAGAPRSLCAPGAPRPGGARDAVRRRPADLRARGPRRRRRRPGGGSVRVLGKGGKERDVPIGPVRARRDLGAT